MVSIQRFVTKVRSYVGAATQPDDATCQSTAIYAVTGGVKSIDAIRSELLQYGEAGDPANMGATIKALLPKGVQYNYFPTASIKQMREWAKQGCSMITHGYFTSGHVIVIDGWSADDGFNVMDPYEEFSATAWDYPVRRNRVAFDGSYSELLIYAACVAGQSKWDASAVYDQGYVNENLGAAWVHVIWP
jgi:hypothetical protein